MKLFTADPLDVLFFRDARPMETNVGFGGHGAIWPHSAILFRALHAALHQRFPGSSNWEHRHVTGRNGKKNASAPANRTERFGALQSIGPFPYIKEHGDSSRGEWLFPAPEDTAVVCETTGAVAQALFPIRDAIDTQTDLPPPLRHGLGNETQPTKTAKPQWWTARAIEAYLRGSAIDPAHLYRNEDIFYKEWATGIGLDDRTNTASEGQLYSAEYLRLLSDGMDESNPSTTKLAFAASLFEKTDDEGGVYKEKIQHLFNGADALHVGGQQRVAQVQTCDVQRLSEALPVSQVEPNETRIKWILLSPAVFPYYEPTDSDGGYSSHPGGWLPNWVAPMPDDPNESKYRTFNGGEAVYVEPGSVLLKPEQPRNGLSRNAWREKVRNLDFIQAKLVAARIPKPLTLTGWTDHARDNDLGLPLKGRATARPRATYLAVPPGAVYYFEASDAKGAQDLVNALSWHGSQGKNAERVIHRRSALFGEQGFGLGVCGSWRCYGE